MRLKLQNQKTCVGYFLFLKVNTIKLEEKKKVASCLDDIFLTDAKKNLRKHILESFTSHQTSAEMCFALEKLSLKVWFCFSSSSSGSLILLRSLTNNLLLITQSPD